MQKTTIDMSADYLSDFVYLTSQKRRIDEFTVIADWENVTGTPNGKLEILAYIEPTDENAYDVIVDIDITELSGKQTRYGDIDCQALRFRYTANEIVSGNLEIMSLMSGK